jgi:hypothetical protein
VAKERKSSGSFVFSKSAFRRSQRSSFSAHSAMLFLTASGATGFVASYALRSSERETNR